MGHHFQKVSKTNSILALTHNHWVRARGYVLLTGRRFVLHGYFSGNGWSNSTWYSSAGVVSVRVSDELGRWVRKVTAVTSVRGDWQWGAVVSVLEAGAGQ